MYCGIYCEYFSIISEQLVAGEVKPPNGSWEDDILLFLFHTCNMHIHGIHVHVFFFICSRITCFLYSASPPVGEGKVEGVFNKERRCSLVCLATSSEDVVMLWFGIIGGYEHLLHLHDISHSLTHTYTLCVLKSWLYFVYKDVVLAYITMSMLVHVLVCFSWVSICP